MTKVNPKKGKKYAADVRVVKLSDDRFAVLYNMVNVKNSKRTLHCDVVDNTGKKVKSKTYKKYKFSGSMQPVLHKGAIYWAEPLSAKDAKLYRIPAL